MTKIIYTHPTLNDLDQIQWIEDTVFNSLEAASKESMKERIEVINDTFVIAKTQDNQVAGFIVGPVTLERYLTDDLFTGSAANPTDAKFQQIISLAIHPDFQGLGIGKQLLKELETIDRKANRSAISLTCVENLIAYYEAHGFVNEGRSNSQLAGEEWYNMVKELN